MDDSKDLDEAIAHAEQVAEKHTKEGTYRSPSEDACARQHQQLAGWLRELRELRDLKRTFTPEGFEALRRSWSEAFHRIPPFAPEKDDAGFFLTTGPLGEVRKVYNIDVGSLKPEEALKFVRGVKEIVEKGLKPNGLRCEVCQEPQFETPHGTTCKNGHGGAPGVRP